MLLQNISHLINVLSSWAWGVCLACTPYVVFVGGMMLFSEDPTTEAYLWGSALLAAPLCFLVSIFMSWRQYRKASFRSAIIWALLPVWLLLAAGLIVRIGSVVT